MQEQCPFCKDALGAELRACTGCAVLVHAACEREFGRCPTIGCAGTWGDAEPSAPTEGRAKLEVDLDAPLADAPIRIGVREVPEDEEQPATSNDPLTRGRRRLRRALVAAGVLLATTALWAHSRKGPDGQLSAYGGWFTGHGSPVSAVLGTIDEGAYDKDLGNTAILTVAYGPEGRRLVSVSDDGEVILWSTNGRELAQVRPPHTQPGRRERAMAAFAPDGRSLVVSLGDRFLEAWELPKGGQLLSPALQTQNGGTMLAMTTSPTGVRWAHRQGRQLTVNGVTPQGHSSQLLAQPCQPDAAAAFAQEGRYLFVAGGPQLERWDLRYSRLERLPLRPHSKAFTVDEKGEFVAWLEDTPIVARLSDGNVRRLGPTMGSWMFDGLALSDDGALLAAVGPSGPVWIWSTETGLRLAAYDNTVGTRGPLFSPGGSDVLTWGRDQVVRRWGGPY